MENIVTERAYPIIPKGYIVLFHGEDCPLGWRFCPEYEIGNFPDAEIGIFHGLTWEDMHTLNPEIHFIMKE